MAARIQNSPLFKDDYFTKISFSELIGELRDKENVMLENIQLQPTSERSSNVVKFDRQVEKWLGNKSDSELINTILM